MSTDTTTDIQPKRRGERTDESLKQMPDGRWRARPTLGTDPVTGKQVRPTKIFDTKKVAQAWVREQHKQWSTATWAPKSDQTFDEVADHWLKVRRADGISPNTIRADRDDLARARRVFGSKPVAAQTDTLSSESPAQPRSAA